MPFTILDGKKLSRSITERLKRIDWGKQPELLIIQVDDVPSSSTYIKYKKKKCEEIGIKCHHKVFDSSQTSEADIVERITKANDSKNITGILLQLPIPEKYNVRNVIETISPYKDVDCLTICNMGKLLNHNAPYFENDSDWIPTLLIPPTAYGIYLLLKHYEIETIGKHAVVLGKGELVGKPLSVMLSNEFDMKMSVTMCDKYTDNVDRYISSANMLVSATGVKQLVKNINFENDDLTLIDVGCFYEDGKVLGEISDECYNLCKYGTPVPGGVGPMTVVSLMINLYCCSTNYQ